MTDQTTPYIAQKPGDVITSQAWNLMQEMIKEDIAGQIAKAVEAIKRVDQSEDAEKLGGKTPEQLAQDVLEYVMRHLPKRAGYQNMFKKLEVGKEAVIEHKLGAFPLVDVYQLEYFPVAASEDGHIFKTLTTFYLHHSSESRIRFRPEETPNASLESVEIDPPDGHPYHIPFQHMLELYGVEAPEDSTLGDIETEFWKAFNAPPNDRFDDDQIFHSPWFDRCCGERRTVQGLRRDWNDIWFQVRPRKTLNYPAATTALKAKGAAPLPAPNQVQVAQFDLTSIGLQLLVPPLVPQDDVLSVPGDHLKVLVVLKV